MSLVTIPPKDPGETKTWVLDFVPDMSAEEIIVSVEREVQLKGGVDATPQAVLDGVATISTDGKEVQQRIKAGLAGCKYNVRILATTNAGNVHLISGLMPVLNL